MDPCAGTRLDPGQRTRSRQPKRSPTSNAGDMHCETGALPAVADGTPIGSRRTKKTELYLLHLVQIGADSQQSTGFLERQPRAARKHLRGVADAEVAEEVRADARPGEELCIDFGIVEARHRPAVESDRTCSDDQVGPLKRPVAKRGALRQAGMALVQVDG